MLQIICFLCSKFSNLAWDVLSECQSVDDKKTHDCLLKEHEHWNKAKCIDIATQTDNRRFMSHNACQTLINNIWMGNLVDTHSTGNMRVNSRVVRIVCTQRETERDLTQSCNKSPYTNRTNYNKTSPKTSITQR